MVSLLFIPTKNKTNKITTNKTTTTKTTICICWLVVYLFKRYGDITIGAKVLQCRSEFVTCCIFSETGPWSFERVRLTALR